MTEIGEGFKPDHIIDGKEPTEHADLKARFTDTMPEDRLDAYCNGATFLPDSVRDAFRSDTISLFHTGFPDDDEGYRKDAACKRLEVLHQLASYYRSFYENKSPLPEVGMSLAKLKTESQKATPNRPLPTKNRLVKMLGDYIADMQGDVNDEYHIGKAVKSILVGIQFLYCTVTEPVWEETDLQPNRLSAEDIASVYTEDAPAEIGFTDLVTKTAEVRDIDTSQETLDARLATFTGLLNADLSLAVLKELTVYANISYSASLRLAEK